MVRSNQARRTRRPNRYNSRRTDKWFDEVKQRKVIEKWARMHEGSYIPWRKLKEQKPELFYTVTPNDMKEKWKAIKRKRMKEQEEAALFRRLFAEEDEYESDDLSNQD